MKRIIATVILIVIGQLIAWFVSKGFLWIEFTMKPYTAIGKALTTWGNHFLFAIIFLYVSIYLSMLINQRKADKK